MSHSVLHVAARLAEREQALKGPNSVYQPTPAMLPNKLQAIETSVVALAAAGVDYALIGGLAVGIRSGVPRATLNVDFAIRSTEPLDPVKACLVAAGLAHQGTHAHSMNFIHPSGEPVQLAFDPEFDAMIERAEPMHFDTLEVAVVTREDLLRMKRRAAADPARRKSKALRDQADIELLLGDVGDPHEGW